MHQALQSHQAVACAAITGHCTAALERAGTRTFTCVPAAHVAPLQVLQGDIVPSLELLRQQCGQYNEWAKLSSRAEQLKRIIVAYDFCECLKCVCASA